MLHTKVSVQAFISVSCIGKRMSISASQTYEMKDATLFQWFHVELCKKISGKKTPAHSSFAAGA